MNYESMSDFEINKAVSMVVDFGDLVCFVNDEREVVYICEVDGAYSMNPVGDFNPCNNPADAWPIIIDNKISIEYDQSEDSWIAHQGDYLIGKYVSICGYRYQYSDKNPLRAAMIVFLMMNENTKSNEGDEEWALKTQRLEIVTTHA